MFCLTQGHVFKRVPTRNPNGSNSHRSNQTIKTFPMNLSDNVAYLLRSLALEFPTYLEHCSGFSHKLKNLKFFQVVEDLKE